MNKTCGTNVKAILSKKGLQHRTLCSTCRVIGKTKEQTKNIERNVQKKENEENFQEESIIDEEKMNINK